MRIIWRGTRVVAETVVGYLLLLAGVVMLVTPGPGVVAIIAGLAVLSRHYHWAEHLKRASLARIHDSRTAMRARLAARRAGGDAAAPLADEPASDDHRPVDGDRQHAA
jgi:drug/metabolite transporter (DMT)-like permease